MFVRFARIVGHLAGFALVCALAAYWVVRIVTPAPTAAPAPVAGPAPRDVDPILAARMFGLVQLATQAPVISNVQVAGVFAAGRDSSAVLIVDSKPARAYVLGQEVAPGSKLVAVRANGVTLEGSGGRQELSLAGQPNVAPLGGMTPGPSFVLQNGVLTAPSLEGAAIRAPTAPPPPSSAPPPVPPASMPGYRPQPPVPGMPPTVNAPPPVAGQPPGTTPATQ